MGIPNINIEIGGPGANTYKSIEEVQWHDIPGFVILTGLNGAGKSQLLEVLAYGLNNAPLPNNYYINSIKVHGQTIERGATAYLPSNNQFQEGQQSTITSLQSLKINMHQQMLQNNMDLKTIAKRNRIEREIGTDLSQISPVEFATRLPDSLVHLLSDVDLAFEMAHVFVQYRAQMASLLLSEKSVAEAAEQLGEAPWDMIDADLAAVAFPYTTVPPTGPIYEPFAFQLVEGGSRKIIKPSDLSTGEKIILEMILWLFISKKRTSFPKLFLMDEPDAHLHPQMTLQFLDVISQVLVKRHDVRVIMTTHSPSTVALAPENSLFEMRRGARDVRKCTREEALALLTAGLVTVSPSSKHVIVEDQDDIDFYSTIRDILTDYGPRKDNEALALSPTILFLPASSGRGSNKTGGGCTVVYKWVEKFDADPLKQLFRGLVDRDVGNKDAGRVFVTQRYSIENYILDPFNVYVVIIQAGGDISACRLMVGEEHLVATQSAAVLQAIVDEITGKVSSLHPALQSITALDNVYFTSGVTLQYPQWMINFRGHDLLPMFQAAWGGHNVIKTPSLLAGLKRIRMIPTDIAQLLKKLQV